MKHLPQFDENELHAYADGQLPPERVSAVEEWLAAEPEAAAEVRRWQALNEEIRDHYDVPVEPLPRWLRPGQIRATRVRRARRWLAASVVVFLLGGTAGWLGRSLDTQDQQPSVRLADEGIGAYKIYAVEARHPVEVPAGERQHLQTWLSKRLDHSLTVPDLSAAGYHLVGGRLLANFGEPRAMFMYEAGDGSRLTVYAGRNPLSRAVDFRFHRSDDVGAICWLDPDMGYAVVARADEPSLLRLAHLVHEQVEPENRR